MKNAIMGRVRQDFGKMVWVSVGGVKIILDPLGFSLPMAGHFCLFAVAFQTFP
jgi:hypothetical protein